MTATTLHELLIGRIDVRVDRRTHNGELAPVAAGRLVGGDANGNTLQIHSPGQGVRTVRLSPAHLVAYTPTSGGGA